MEGNRKSKKSLLGINSLTLHTQYKKTWTLKGSSFPNLIISHDGSGQKDRLLLRHRLAFEEPDRLFRRWLGLFFARSFGAQAAAGLRSLLQTKINVMHYFCGSSGGTSCRAISILSGEAGLKSPDGLWLYSVQNCCQSFLTGSQAFSNNV